MALRLLFRLQIEGKRDCHIRNFQWKGGWQIPRDIRQTQADWWRWTCADPNAKTRLPQELST